MVGPDGVAEVGVFEFVEPSGQRFQLGGAVGLHGVDVWLRRGGQARFDRADASAFVGLCLPEVCHGLFQGGLGPLDGSDRADSCLKSGDLALCVTFEGVDHVLSELWTPVMAASSIAVSGLVWTGAGCALAAMGDGGVRGGRMSVRQPRSRPRR